MFLYTDIKIVIWISEKVFVILNKLGKNSFRKRQKRENYAYYSRIGESNKGISKYKT